ncbi:unnamed protein product [Arctia plantaginis]|uniref:Uncharacterized protein n=1 Tax=Arctia plantaginis TaxID=874455 RepID=A0A8S1BBE3_ARCPL|nr:unnamed protein product [Arctia plantaginis]
MAIDSHGATEPLNVYIDDTELKQVEIFDAEIIHRIGAASAAFGWQNASSSLTSKAADENKAASSYASKMFRKGTIDPQKWEKRPVAALSGALRENQSS